MSNSWNVAAGLARQGFHVFPLGKWNAPGGGHKVPATSNGHHAATTDAETIAQWANLLPDHNYGVACGPSNLTVVDMDTKDGMDGPGDFMKIASLVLGTYREIEHFTVMTPSGGRHAYFRGALDAPRAKFAGIKSIDVKSSNGYVVGPGCRAPDGGTYRHIGRDRPPQIDDTIARMAAREVREIEHREDRKEIKAEDLRRVLAKIEPGGYNDNWFQTIMAVRATKVTDGDRELTPDEVIDILDEWSARDDDRYRGRDDVAAKFDQFADDGAYTIASVIHAAKENGFQYRTGDASVFNNLPSAAHVPTSGNEWDDKCLTYENWGDFAKNLEWLVKGLFEKGGLHVLSGFYGTLKTFFNLTMFLHLSRGVSPFGPDSRHRVKRPLRTMYVAGEGAFGFKQRIDAYLKHYGLTGADIRNFHFVREMPLLYDAERWDVFVSWVASMDIDILALDTWSRLIAGLDGNSTKDASLAVLRLQQLQRLGIAVVVVHHTGKDESKGSKGAVDLPAAAELELIVRSNPPEGKVILGMRKIKNSKSWEPDDMAFAVHPVDLGTDEDGDPVESLALEFEGPYQPPPPSKPSKELTDAETDKVTKNDIRAKTLDCIMGAMADPASDHHVPDSYYSKDCLKKFFDDPTRHHLLQHAVDQCDPAGKVFRGDPSKVKSEMLLLWHGGQEAVQRVFGDRARTENVMGHPEIVYYPFGGPSPPSRQGA